MDIANQIDKFWSKTSAYLSKADAFLDKYKAWKAVKEVKAPIYIFLITRIVIMFAVYVGVVMFIQQGAGYNTEGYPTNYFINSFMRWDSGYYIGIMNSGYSAPHNAAFFPMFPMLIWITRLFIWNDAVASLFTANMCFLAALIVLYKFMINKFENKDLAERVVWYYSIFPTAFYFSSGYTESTYLLLSLLTFYFAEKKNWQLSALFGIFTALTRSTGFFLVLPVLIIYMADIKYDIRKIRSDILSIFAIPLGLFIYMSILVSYGRPALDFIYTGQKLWPRFFALPWWDLFRSIEEVMNFPIAAIVAGQFPVKLFCTVVLVSLFLVLSCAALYRIGFAYGIYALIVLGFFLSNPGKEFMLWSDLRYVLPIFPVFIMLAMYGKNKYVNYMVMMFFIMLLALFATAFAMGGWIA